MITHVIDVRTTSHWISADALPEVLREQRSLRARLGVVAFHEHVHSWWWLKTNPILRVIIQFKIIFGCY